MVSQTEEQVEALNRDGVAHVKMDTLNDHMAIVILTPLMMRVLQQLKHASELVFMDSSCTCDRDNCRIFLLLTHSCVGGLPWGCFITSDSHEVIQLALNLYNNLLNEKCFHGRGLRASIPKIDTDAIQKLDEEQFMVPSEEDSAQHYCVDMGVGICTCYIGATVGVMDVPEKWFTSLHSERENVEGAVVQNIEETVVYNTEEAVVQNIEKAVVQNIEEAVVMEDNAVDAQAQRPPFHEVSNAALQGVVLPVARLLQERPKGSKLSLNKKFGEGATNTKVAKAKR
ncbi:hypothetical protein CAPTEDRAFT_202835 [Capitella teleta]|uniref:SWIM-type domain-containing protein n=1 Tax=Capitella teleta TaxID=283909 RepID=R7T4L1_CAPTE|nr:hypothetical protein CAPTEDRAFT_202835 [Capitella teleta]|eukprot:ELT87982.1 hypothetical protein CAPTEDRAFT_202835 [Capitella teleta]